MRAFWTGCGSCGKGASCPFLFAGAQAVCVVSGCRTGDQERLGRKRAAGRTRQPALRRSDCKRPPDLTRSKPGFRASDRRSPYRRRTNRNTNDTFRATSVAGRGPAVRATGEDLARPRARNERRDTSTRENPTRLACARHPPHEGEGGAPISAASCELPEERPYLPFMGRSHAQRAGGVGRRRQVRSIEGRDNAAPCSSDSPDPASPGHPLPRSGRGNEQLHRPRSEIPFFTASLPNFARSASTALSAAFSRSTLWSARSA